MHAFNRQRPAMGSQSDLHFKNTAQAQNTLSHEPLWSISSRSENTEKTEKPAMRSRSTVLQHQSETLSSWNANKKRAHEQAFAEKSEEGAPPQKLLRTLPDTAAEHAPDSREAIVWPIVTRFKLNRRPAESAVSSPDLRDFPDVELSNGEPDDEAESVPRQSEVSDPDSLEDSLFDEQAGTEPIEDAVLAGDRTKVGELIQQGALNQATPALRQRLKTLLTYSENLIIADMISEELDKTPGSVFGIGLHSQILLNSVVQGHKKVVVYLLDWLGDRLSPANRIIIQDEAIRRGHHHLYKLLWPTEFSKSDDTPSKQIFRAALKGDPGKVYALINEHPTALEFEGAPNTTPLGVTNNTAVVNCVLNYLSLRNLHAASVLDRALEDQTRRGNALISGDLASAVIPAGD